MNPHPPPRLADWLLRCLLPAADRETILGDLAEELSLRALSPGSCRTWYWGQTLRSLSAIGWKTVWQGRWIRTSLAALSAYVAAAVLEFAADAALGRAVNRESAWLPVLSLIVGLTTMLAGGYLAARLRPGADKLMSVMVFVAVIALLAAQAGNAPLWYGLAFLVAGPLSTLAGGKIVRRSKA